MWRRNINKSGEEQEESRDKYDLDESLIRTRKPFPYKRLIILIVFIAVLGGIIVFQVIPRNGKYVVPVATPEKETLSIYIPGDEGLLEKRSVEIARGLSEREKAETIIKELQNEDVLPEELVLREFVVDREGVIYLNLSHHIRAEHMATDEEIAAVYGLVNSFISNFKDSKSVHILVEGEALYTMGGLLYTYMPLQFNNQLLEE